MTQMIKPMPDVKIKVQIEVEYTIPATQALNAYGTTDPQEMAEIDAEAWSDVLNVTRMIDGLTNDPTLNGFVSTTVTGEAAS